MSWNTKVVKVWNPEELPKNFAKLDGWHEFLERWNSIKYKGEAIGLMYDLIELAGMNRFTHHRISPIGLMRFFLHYAKSKENNKIQIKAQQLLFGKVLPNLSHTRNDYHDDERDDYIEVLTEIIEFLGIGRHEGLQLEPFPGHVLGFLLKFQTLYSGHAAEYDVRNKVSSDVIYESFIKALLVWIGGYYLWVPAYSVSPSIKKQENLVRDFLCLNDWTESDCVRLLPDVPHGRVKDHSVIIRLIENCTPRELANASAYMALLKIQYELVRQRPV